MPELLLESIPRDQAIAELSRLWDIAIDVDWTALEGEGVERHQRVSVRGKDLLLWEALRCVLESEVEELPEIQIEPRPGRVLVTAATRDFSNSLVRTYGVGDLLEGRCPRIEAPSPGGLFGGRGSTIRPADDLLTLIMDVVDPDSWRDNGGRIGVAQVVGDRLIVTQNWENHRQLRMLLAELRGPSQAAEPPAPAHGLRVWRESVKQWVPCDPSELETALRQHLGDVQLDSVTLRDALRWLDRRADAALLIDETAVSAAEIDLDRKVSVRLKDPTTADVLLALFAAEGSGRMAFNIQHGTVQITASKDDAPWESVTRVYEIKPWLQSLGLPLIDPNYDRWVEYPSHPAQEPPPEPDPSDPFGRRAVFIDRLTTLLMNTIDPNSWRDNGGSIGSIRELNGSLIITQTWPNQERVAGFLSALKMGALGGKTLK